MLRAPALLRRARADQGGDATETTAVVGELHRVRGVVVGVVALGVDRLGAIGDLERVSGVPRTTIHYYLRQGDNVAEIRIDGGLRTRMKIPLSHGEAKAA